MFYFHALKSWFRSNFQKLFIIMLNGEKKIILIGWLVGFNDMSILCRHGWLFCFMAYQPFWGPLTMNKIILIKVSNISVLYSFFFVYTPLNIKTVLFQTIPFSESTKFSSIWPIDRTLSGATTPGESGPGSNGNKETLRILQSSSITEASASGCLVSHPGHWLGESYDSAEVQSVYSVASVDAARTIGLTISII